MTTILDTIIDNKRLELADVKTRRPLADVQAEINGLDPPRDFGDAITRKHDGDIRLIAEIKRSSPSAGLIVPDFDAVAIARDYHAHGASALSVLTDARYFDGRLETIAQVKQAVPLPVLRKDFMIDAYQVYESRAALADAVLLIAEVLDAQHLVQMHRIALELGMSVLIEVHSETTLRMVLDTLGTPKDGRFLLGINNRDLAAQRTDIRTMGRLARHLPAGTTFVAESGIATRADVQVAMRAGAGAMLVGEALLRAKDRGQLIGELLGQGA